MLWSKNPEREAGTERVRHWTRERFDLAEDATVFVSELACGLPGCPPLETAVAFWTADGARHHFKIFKPAAEVVEADLPFAWMREALAVPEGWECDCC